MLIQKEFDVACHPLSADAGKAIGRTGDEGIDGIIKEDRLGLDVIYIQAKRWQNTIGRPDIQQFVGALAGKGTKKGVFITTSKFSEQAKSYLPADIKVVLIDGDMQSMSILVFLSSVNTKSNA
jgi:restriction system protein